jgi:hypothetical protein
MGKHLAKVAHINLAQRPVKEQPGASRCQQTPPSGQLVHAQPHHERPGHHHGWSNIFSWHLNRRGWLNLAASEMSFNICRGTLGSLAMFTAIRRTSSNCLPDAVSDFFPEPGPFSLIRGA